MVAAAVASILVGVTTVSPQKFPYMSVTLFVRPSLLSKLQVTLPMVVGVILVAEFIVTFKAMVTPPLSREVNVWVLFG